MARKNKKLSNFEGRLDAYFARRAAERERIQPQQERLLSSIEGVSDEELHAAFVLNSLRKFEEVSKQFEQLFQEPKEDGIDLDELFERAPSFDR